ncbi:MAG: response regulator [Devosia sp.]
MPTAPRPSLKILIIDDDEDIRDIAMMCLEMDPGFITRAVESGKEGLLVAAQWQPDLILIDVVMPEMDGPATVQRLARDLRTRHIPVVFLSARSDTEAVAKAMSLTIAGIITKPFDPVTLAELVRSHAEPKR